MSDTPQVLLAHHLKALKLPSFLRECDKLPGSARPMRSIMSATRWLRLAELECALLCGCPHATRTPTVSWSVLWPTRKEHSIPPQKAFRAARAERGLRRSQRRGQTGVVGRRHLGRKLRRRAEPGDVAQWLSVQLLISDAALVYGDRGAKLARCWRGRTPSRAG